MKSQIYEALQDRVQASILRSFSPRFDRAWNDMPIPYRWPLWNRSIGMIGHYGDIACGKSIAAKVFSIMGYTT